MKKQVEKPSSEFVREFLSDTELRLDCAKALQSAISTTQKLTPPVIALLASHRHPGISAREAVSLFNSGLNDLSTLVDGLTEKYRNAFNAESARLGPLVAQASREMFATSERIRNLKSTIESAETHFNEKNLRLTNSGLKPDEIAKIHSREERESRLSAMQDELAKTEGRHVALAAFCHSNDLSDLPAGFLDEVGHE